MKKSNNGAFNELKRAFEMDYTQGDYGTSAQALATAAAYATLKGIINKQYDPHLVAMRREIAGGTARLEKIARIVEDAYCTTTNKDGDSTTEERPEPMIALDAALDEIARDGMDLVGVAIVELLNLAERYGNEPEWLDKEVIIVTPMKRIFKLHESIKYKDETITPMKLLYREIRRYIRSQKAAREALNGYTYSEIDGLEDYFIRHEKYADIGGRTNYGAYTADIGIAEDMDVLVNSIGLTPLEKSRIILRLKGYSIRDIAAHEGVSANAIVKSLQRVGEKALKSGIGWNIKID